MINITSQGQDVYISYPRPGDKKQNDHNTFDIGRNFCNKIWNAARLIMTLSDGSIKTVECEMELVDRWILSRYHHTIAHMTDAIDSFRFNDAAHAIYDFIWHDFCDWYLEIIKPRVYAGGSEKDFVLGIAAKVLSGSMQLLHPIMPYITEDIWQRLQDMLGEKHDGSIMISQWPQTDSNMVSDTIESKYGKCPVAHNNRPHTA